MCLCMFSDEPVDDDARAGNALTFKTSMKDAPCKNPCVCVTSFFCCPCMNCWVRREVLDKNLDDYVCCQGYYDCACFKAGQIGDRGNPCCLCIEGLCCASCAVSASRQYVMDQYDLRSDPCDNQIIRFNNFMQLLACFCDILAIFVPECRDMAECIRFIANIVYLITSGCMNAQVLYELAKREEEGTKITVGGAHVAAAATTGPSAIAAAPAAAPAMDRPNKQEKKTADPPLAIAASSGAGSPEQRSFLVTLPPNTYAGTQLYVETPEKKTVVFEVPDGAEPGQKVIVPY